MTEGAAPHGDGGGKVVQLRAVDAQTEVRLDEAASGAGSPPVYLDTTDLGGKKHPIIPDHLVPGKIRKTIEGWAAETAYRIAYHAVRSPWHAIWLTWLAIRGVFVTSSRILRWWHWTEGWELESIAVAAGRPGHHEAMNAHKEGKKTRAKRGQIIGVCAAFALVLMLALAAFAPWWGWALFALALFVPLVLAGRMKGKPIIKAAIVPARFEVPTHPVITRALGAIGIDAINRIIRDGGTLEWVSDVHRDGEGWGVDLNLPFGVTPKMIIQRRAQLASGLRRPLSATWPEAVPGEHEGRLFLWIGRFDLSKVKPPAYPLLKAGQADIFQHVPFATTPRGIGVTVPLFEANWLIGAAMGNGKTASVRVLLSAAALDPLCDVWTHEFSGKGDLEPFAQISHRYTSGLDDESVAYAAESAAMLRRDLERRSGVFKKLPREARPDGKLTRELAGERRLRLRPIVAVFDEIQVAFQHPEYGLQIAADLAHVMRLGRAYGIIIILATQRPDKDSIPTAITGVVVARFCLKMPDHVGNDMILGSGAYKAGFSAVEFRHEIDAGLGWLRGAGDPQAVKTYYLDLRDSAKVAARARAIRQAAGVLSGYALGEDDSEAARSFAADVLTVFSGDTKLWTETIAARLRDHLPSVYADITKDAVAAQLRGLGIEVKQVREPGAGVKAGCEREAVRAVAAVREPADV